MSLTAAASVLGNKAEQLDHFIKEFKTERDRIQSMINKGTYAYYGMKAAALYAGVRGLSLLRLPAMTHTAVTTGAMAGEWTILGKAWAGLASIQLPKFAIGSLQASSKEALADLENSIRNLESTRNKFRDKGLKHESDARRLHRTKLSGLGQKAKNLENKLFEKCGEEKKPTIALGLNQEKTQTFSFGTTHSNKTVKVSFLAQTFGTWDTGGKNEDFLIVKANELTILKTHKKGSTSYSLDAKLDGNGQLVLQFLADVTGDDEGVNIDNVVISDKQNKDI